MAALGVSWLVVIGCGIAGLAGGMLSPLQMVLTEETPEHMRAFSLFTAIMQFYHLVDLPAGRPTRCRLHVSRGVGDDPRAEGIAELCRIRSHDDARRHHIGSGFTGR